MGLSFPQEVSGMRRSAVRASVMERRNGFIGCSSDWGRGGGAGSVCALMGGEEVVTEKPPKVSERQPSEASAV